MPLPRTITRFNRRIANPLMRRIAGRLPLLAIVIHQGRKSGRRYETPVLAFPGHATVTFALTYGTDVDWLKNVMAAGGCRLVHRGKTRELTHPRMLPAGIGRQRVPALIRIILRLLNVNGFVEMDKLPQAGEQPASAGPGTRESQEPDAQREQAVQSVEGTISVEEFWQRARPALGPDAPMKPPPAEPFGDSPELADELLALVMEGRKTATCSALWEYEAAHEALPTPGELSIVLDGAGVPRCVIEITEVRVMPMNEVDEQFAYDEGEDDRTWNSWHAAHERFFGRTLPAIGREFEPTMPLVLKRFHKRYP